MVFRNENDILHVIFTDEKNGEKINVELKLPHLCGTEKQIDWGRDIRTKLILKRLEIIEKEGGIDNLMQDKTVTVEEAIDNFLSLDKKIDELLHKTTNASDIIDNLLNIA